MRSMQSREVFGRMGKILKISALGAAFFVFVMPVFGSARVIVANSAPVIGVLNNTGYYNGVNSSNNYLPNQPVFSVLYTDNDNDAPLYLNVVIGQTVYPMTLIPDQNENYLNGVYYAFVVPDETLSAGKYSYYFETSDGQYTYPWMSTEFGDEINYTRNPGLGNYIFEVKRQNE